MEEYEPCNLRARRTSVSLLLPGFVLAANCLKESLAVAKIVAVYVLA